MAHSPKRRKLNAASYETISGDSSKTAMQTKEKHGRHSIFVRSLPASVTNERLVEHFSQSYPLKHATIVLDSQTKTSRGFGFVTFTDSDDAQAAVQEFNDSVLDGRKIKVEIAEARHRDTAEELGGKTKSVNIRGQELRAKRQGDASDNQPPKLIVRNLPWSIKTADDLTKLFLSYGKVKHAVVPNISGKNHAQAGFGIVILRGKKNAEKALKEVNGKIVDGRTLAVDWAVDRETWEKAQRGEIQEDKSNEAAKDSKLEEAETGNVAADDSNSELRNELSQILNEELEGSNNLGSDGLSTDEESNTEAEPEEEGIALSDSSHTDPPAASKFNTEATTVFIRNLPFTTDDQLLREHFSNMFGPVRYARVVYDQETERSRGTAFVCFRNEVDAKACVINAPKQSSTEGGDQSRDKKRKGEVLKYSILQNETEDPSGKYTMEGRVLQLTRALNKTEADRRADENSKEREKRANDRRRLYLLSEGTIPRGSKLYNMLGKAELDIRETSAKQRQKLVKNNPNLGLSLTRLSVRNLPRWIDGKQLKQQAREAIVEFAKDVKEGKRIPLSKEEIARDGEAGREADKTRREKGKGLVKQAKVIYESELTGGKVGEGKGGRSRGYGFVEYHSHRHALMGLRWLNGHLVKAQAGDGQERGKRLIVEFAIENAQVVQRRNDRELRARDRKDGDIPRKRKRGNQEDDPDEPESKVRNQNGVKTDDKNSAEKAQDQEEKNKVAARNRIIAQKRQKRKARRGKS